MFKLTLRGVVPIEETEIKIKKPAAINQDPKNMAEELCLEPSDFWAIYIAAMQTITPIILFFVVAYFIAIMFVTKVWFV